MPNDCCPQCGAEEIVIVALQCPQGCFSNLPSEEVAKLHADYEGMKSESFTYREALREVELLRAQLAASELERNKWETLAGDYMKNTDGALDQRDQERKALAAALHERDEANALSDENVEILRVALSTLEELRVRYVNSYCDLESAAKDLQECRDVGNAMARAGYHAAACCLFAFAHRERKCDCGWTAALKEWNKVSGEYKGAVVKPPRV
jgi:hypothetical protein